MTTPKSKILVIQPIHPDAMRLLDDRDDVTYDVLTDTSLATMCRAAADAHAITIRAVPLPVEVIDAAPLLRVVSRHGVGYDNVPVDACTARGIPVTIVGSVNTVSVAEHTMYLVLAAARAGAMLDHAVRTGDFGARDRSTAVELAGRTMLVVGYGRIGREVARRAAAFGLRVLVFDPWWTGDMPSDVERVERLDDGLSRADVLTLHVPLTDETRDLVDAPRLDRLPRGAIVVNTARGGLVDEEALLARVRSGHLHGAGLDVFVDEPLSPASPLVDEPRIVLTPHSAALSEDALVAMGTMTIRNALAALDGQLDPAYVVNPTVLG